MASSLHTVTASNETGSASTVLTITVNETTPSGPTGLSANPLSGATIGINWVDQSTNEANFALESSTDGSTFTVLATLPSNTTSYTHTGASQQQDYFYRVRALALGVQSSYSNLASARIALVPSAPANLTANPGNAQSILAWTASAGAVSYKVKRSASGTGPFAQLQAGLNGTSYTDLTALNGSTYYYVVTASNVSGESPNSNVASTTPQAIPVISYTGTPFSLIRTQAIANTSPVSTGGPLLSCTSSPALPAGLSLSSNCTISGTPSAVAPARDYAITATNSGGSGSTKIRITVRDIPPTISFASSTLVTQVDTAFSPVSPTLSSSIQSVSVAPSLPTGMLINNSTGTVSGTPTAAQKATPYVFTATNLSGETASATLTITVNAPNPKIAYSGSP